MDHTWRHVENSFTNEAEPETYWEDAWEKDIKTVVAYTRKKIIEFDPKKCWICWILDLRILIFIQKKREEGLSK